MQKKNVKPLRIYRIFFFYWSAFGFLYWLFLYLRLNIEFFVHYLSQENLLKPLKVLHCVAIMLFTFSIDINLFNFRRLERQFLVIQFLSEMRYYLMMMKSSKKQVKTLLCHDLFIIFFLNSFRSTEESLIPSVLLKNP